MHYALRLLLLGALGAVSIGCGSERRFCDDTGCYYCDGLGCRPVGEDGDAGGPDGSEPPPPPPNDCTGDENCDSGDRCSAGECRPVDDLCHFNHECAGELVCVDGRCVGECQGDADCADGQTCDSGFCWCVRSDCEVDDRPAPFCTSDAGCEHGHPCVGGTCRTPCTEHQDCLRFDVQFNFCLDGYCATTNEVTTDCQLSSDCADGDRCIDGVCR